MFAANEFMVRALIFAAGAEKTCPFNLLAELTNKIAF
jgi:hypothetical protein